MQFIATMRRLSGGKPAGFKLCIGHPWEFLAICKAMLETKIYPDFIVVDGTEGGTGAAPLEFSTISVSPSSASAATSNCRVICHLTCRKRHRNHCPIIIPPPKEATASGP